MERGFALDELAGMKTGREREAQGESGGEQSPPTVGAAGSNAVPPSSHPFDGDGVAPRRENDVSPEAGKYGSSQSPATGEYSLGQGVWWGSTATHRWRSTE